jgi:hypothetical protein
MKDALRPAMRLQGVDAAAGLRLRALRAEDAAAAAEVIREAFAAQSVATDPPSRRSLRPNRRAEVASPASTRRRRPSAIDC